MQIDPASNEISNAFTIDGYPESAVQSNDRVWVGVEGSILELDAQTGSSLAQIPGPGGYLASTPGRIWALASRDVLKSVDTSTAAVASTVDLGLSASDSVSGGPFASGDAVWVIASHSSDSDVGSGSLIRIDPSSSAVTTRVDLPRAVSVVAVSAEAVWVTDNSGENASLTRIDGLTGETSEPVNLDGQWTPFAVGGDRVWLMGNYGDGSYEIGGFNADVGSIDVRVSVTGTPAYDGSAIFDGTSSAIWISENGGGVTRIDLSE
ncbi:MAG: hypothetical protein M3P11_12970 [Actinomycetota bacterium]|nr:hypothetical protein [Actinomycetota bacterium]